MSDLIQRLEKMAVCVYLATDASVADDISDGLKKAIERIAELEAAVLKATADSNAVVCGKADRITELEADNARLRVDAAIGAVVWKYIDRMNDVVPSDPAERILCEFCHAVQPVMDAAKEQS